MITSVGLVLVGHPRCSSWISSWTIAALTERYTCSVTTLRDLAFQVTYTGG
jgi:hypothetical protein